MERLLDAREELTRMGLRVEPIEPPDAPPDHPEGPADH